MMKKYFQIICFLALIPCVSVLNSCNSNCIKGSGTPITEDRNVGTFSKVEFGGSIKLKIKQDSTNWMKITADDNIIKQIKTRVSGDVLKIEMDGNFCNSGEVVVELSSKVWSGIKASGATQIISENQINSDDFELDLSGSSQVDLNLVAAKFKMETSGSSEIKLKGQARQSDVNVSGASEINAFDFVVSDFNIETSGSSKCAINVLNSLNVNSSGSSEILYKGLPKNINNKKSGSSELKHVD
jgi:Putative auto-transporter adhesin, head GIN domain